LLRIRDEIASTHQFMPFQTPKAFRNARYRGGLGFIRALRSPDRAARRVFGIFPGGFRVQLHCVKFFSFA
jgi:hypothetical protein